MKHLFLPFALLVSPAISMAADESFSRSVTPSDYTSAGLQKLTPEERARLDSLVNAFKRGALEQARKETAVAAAAKARAEDAAARAQAEVRTVQAERQSRAPDQSGRKAGGLLAKVLLPAGTEVEYSTIESRIVGNFQGWESRTTFQLENGQRWQAESSTSYVTPPVASPAVKISAGALGAFYMTVEGVKPRVKVRLVTDNR